MVPDTIFPEVCAIDVAKGEIVAHVKSRKREMPGNLLFSRGQVISQTATELVAYPELKVKLQEIDKAIGKNPNDPIALTDRAVLRLDKGDLVGTVEDLRAALKNQPPKELLPKTKAKLYEVLTRISHFPPGARAPEFA